VESGGDEYREKLLKIIEEKAASGGKETPGPKVKPKAATNVVDLVAVLQKSLAESKKKQSASTGDTGKKKLKKAA
jgi:non-homologous end joining protein Ku